MLQKYGLWDIRTTNHFRIWFNWLFNATWSNISAISWRQVLVLEETGVPRENHQPWESTWQTLSRATASRVHPFCNLQSRERTHAVLVEETGVPGENHLPVAKHWPTLPHNIVSSTSCLRGVRIHNDSGNRHWLHR